jgi:hypothetical protein
VTPAPTVTDAHRRSWRANGYYRIDGFAPPEVGQAMLADVVGLARAADGSLAADGTLVLPEANLAWVAVVRDREAVLHR